MTEKLDQEGEIQMPTNIVENVLHNSTATPMPKAQNECMLCTRHLLPLSEPSKIAVDCRVRSLQSNTKG